LNLATRPNLIGSPPITNTIGMLALAAFAARAATIPALETITDTGCPARSAANAGSRLP
jgi:hypothetical protein